MCEECIEFIHDKIFLLVSIIGDIVDRLEQIEQYIRILVG